MPAKPRADDRRFSPLEARQTSAAVSAVAAIGGPLMHPELDPAQRSLAEGGGGVAGGFELAEQELIEAAEHGERPSVRSRTRSPPSTTVLPLRVSTAKQITRSPASSEAAVAPELSLTGQSRRPTKGVGRISSPIDLR